MEVIISPLNERKLGGGAGDIGMELFVCHTFDGKTSSEPVNHMQRNLLFTRTGHVCGAGPVQHAQPRDAPHVPRARHQRQARQLHREAEARSVTFRLLLTLPHLPPLGGNVSGMFALAKSIYSLTVNTPLPPTVQNWLTVISRTWRGVPTKIHLIIRFRSGK